MSLDPQARALLDRMAAAGMPPLSTMPPTMAREVMRAMRPEASEVEPVEHVEDRRIPGPAGEIPVRVYRPLGEKDGALPVVAYFHGGGWVIGDLETHDPACRALANASGCVIVSVDYRLAPEHKFPAAVDDTYAATLWLAEHAAEVGGDPSRLAVAGDSAGGNLAAVVSLLARDRGAPSLSYQALVYPVTNFSFDTPSYRDNAEGYFLTRDSMVWFWGHYLTGEADGASPLASPLRAPNLKGLPPAMVITAEFDPLRDEGEAYADRLREAGVPVTCRRYDGMIHGFFTLPTVLDRGKDAIREVGAALRQALGA